MLSFINYLLMIEAKVDDLSAKHPEHADAIRAYHAADPTPTKKFLPWLTKQHIAGHVTPDDVRLHSTLKNFDKVKHSLDKKDHSAYHYNDLATAVGDRVKSKLEADEKKNSVETIHKEPNGITAQHIKTKEASQDLYGGGNERGGKKGCARGTSWCVSARSEGNLFHNYGHMYTIHDPNDDNAPYAVHPFSRGGTITSRHNDGDNSHEEVLEEKPHLKNAVDAIMNHSAKHITKALDNPNEHWTVRKAAILHPKATAAHITKVIDNPNEDSSIREAAIRHKNATAEHITKVIDNPKEHWSIREAAIRHKNATAEHINKVLDNPNEHLPVREAAINHPKATAAHITKIIDNPNEHWTVRRAAIRHKNATAEHITKVLDNPKENPYVRMAAQEVLRKRNAEV
jgi:hypothetical protein